MSDQRNVTASIGLPVYNGEQFLAQAIESVLAQTLGDFELVISDNASTDATEDICRRYAARDARVRYHRLGENVGAHTSSCAAHLKYSPRDSSKVRLKFGAAPRFVGLRW